MPNKPGRLATDHTVYQAWMESSDWWDGTALYLDLDTAKAHAAYDYEGDEYGHPDEDDDEEPGARPAFTWTEKYGRWMLYDGGRDTGVRIATASVYRPATAEEIVQQDAERAARDAESAVKYAGMSGTEALETAARACTAAASAEGAGR